MKGRRHAWLHRLLLGAICCAGCASPEQRAPTADDASELLDATRRAVARVQADSDALLALESARRAAREHERRADLASGDSGFGRRIDVLAAAADPHRERRLRRLEVAHASGAPVEFERFVDHLVEQDEASFAANLEGDRAYSVLAGFFNGLLATAFAALNGNPIGVLQPAVTGLDGLLRDVPLDPRDRRLAALHRTMQRKGDTDSALRERVDAEVRALQDATFDEAIWIGRVRLAAGDVDGAAMQLHVASAVRPLDAERARLAQDIEEAARDRAARLRDALRVVPIERGLGVGDTRDAFASSAARLLVGADDVLVGAPLARAAESGRDAADAVAYARALERAARAPRERRGELLAAFAAPARGRDAAAASATTARAEVLARSIHVDPFPALRERDDAHARERRDFVLLGRRPSHDPLRCYREARSALQRSWLDRLEPIFWIPATVFRSAVNLFVDPVDDQPVAGALAVAARRGEPGDPRRARALERLGARAVDARRFDDAVAFARAANAPPDRVEALERKAATAREDEEEAARSRAAALRPGGISIPAQVFQPFAARFRLDRDLVDGRRENGEVVPRGIRMEGDALVFDVEEDGVVRRVTRTLEPGSRALAQALLLEWGFQKRAARAETYESLHGGVPVELYAGVGPAGVAAYPRLLPEDYRAADRKLWE